jgi:ATP-binding cassette subfamily B protein
VTFFDNEEGIKKLIEKNISEEVKKMFKRKFVRQESLKDCGAACLLMVMKHYGGNYPIERLREMMGIDKSGINAYNLIKTAISVGFDARGYKCYKYEDLKCHSIAHVIINKTYHHFVVIHKVDFKKKTIIIADPALGYKKYTFADFDLVWTHVVITLYPIRKIDNINTLKNARKTINRIIKPYKKTYTLIFFISIIYTIFNMLDTFYFKLVIDDISLSLSTSLSLFIFFIIVFITKTIIDYIRSELLIHTDYMIDRHLMETTFKHLLLLPQMYFNSRQTGDIISRLNDLSYVREFINRIATILLIDLVLVIGSFIIMFFISTKLLLISIVILIIYFMIVAIFNRKIKNYVIKNQEEEAIVSSSFIEIVKGINTIKNLGVENDLYKNTMSKYNNFINNNYKFNKTYNLIKMFKDGVTGGGLIFIIFIGSILVIRGFISISELIIYIFFLNYFLEPMKNIFDIEPVLRASSNALIRISEFYDIEEENKTSDIKIKGSITINNASFTYNGIDNVFNNISFHINSGEKVMISGSSGVGKSTIAKMIMGFLSTNQHQISIDNKDICEYSFNDIRKNICYVSQNELLFTDSLYNNIKLYRDIDREKIDNVIKITEIDEIIKKHNLDSHMLIEEDGANLSGGERQRIMIARALLKNSQIYIFDESMNEINVSLERKILSNIFNNYTDKTIIVITHRLNNTDLYDRVILLDNKNKKEGVL